MTSNSVHLASSSVRRKDILDALGVSFTAQGVDIDESPLPGEEAGDMVMRLAEAKARAASSKHHVPVLGSDTVVTLDGQIFGKPSSERDALKMLASLSGRCHQVMTAVVVVVDDQMFSDLSVTDVFFRTIGPAEARQYWRSGEPKGKAGAYAIQGIGGVFVETISGSYSGVVGLPVYQTALLLEQAGVAILAPIGKQDV